jgi:hypothetical protein
MDELDEFYESLRPAIASSVTEVSRDLRTPTREDVLFEILIASYLVAQYGECEEDDADYRPIIFRVLKRALALVELVFNLSSVNVRLMWIDILNSTRCVANFRGLKDFERFRSVNARKALLDLRQAKRMFYKVSQFGQEEFDTINGLRTILSTFRRRLALRKRVTAARLFELHAIVFALSAAHDRGEINIEEDPLLAHVQPLVAAIAQSKRFSVKDLSARITKIAGIVSQHIN